MSEDKRVIGVGRADEENEQPEASGKTTKVTFCFKNGGQITLPALGGSGNLAGHFSNFITSDNGNPLTFLTPERGKVVVDLREVALVFYLE